MSTQYNILGRDDRRVIRGTKWKSIDPVFNIQSCAALVIMVLLSVLTVFVLIILMIFTEHKSAVQDWSNGFRSVSSSLERAVNMSRSIQKNLPPVNWTLVAQRSLAQDEDSWVNASKNAQSTLRSVENLFKHIDKSRTVEHYTSLAMTVTDILSSPEVARHVKVYSNLAIWVIESMESDDSEAIIGLAKGAILNVVEILKSEETLAVVDRFVNSNEMRSLVSESKDLVKDAKHSMHIVNDIIEQVRDEHLVSELGSILEQVKNEDIPGKLGNIYNKVNDAEHKFGHLMEAGYAFGLNMFREEFSKKSVRTPDAVIAQPKHVRGRLARDNNHERDSDN